MKFLKPEIFYSEKDNDNPNAMNQARQDYLEYLLSIRNQISKKLLEVYKQTDRFHDFQINELIYNSNDKRNDYILMHLDCYEVKLLVKFHRIFRFEIKHGIDKKDYKYWGGGFDDIVLCEIRYEEKLNVFEAHTANGADIIIGFSKFTVIQQTQN